MSLWLPDQLRTVLGGRWLQRGTDDPLTAPATGVSIDSRTTQRGQVFFALRGERHDGHDHLAEAVQRGAAMLVVQRETLDETARQRNIPVVRVNDTLSALTRLAGAYRRTLRATVVGITGSAGKTTTRQMIHAVLQQTRRGRAAEKSFNNHIGVPLTILAARPRDEYLLVEIGTSAPGEINALSAIAQPDIAVITHVGRAHLEKLGDLAGVAREKASLLNHLPDDGLAVVNGDLPLLEPYLRNLPRVIRYGRSEHCDLRLTDYAARGGAGCRFQVNRRVWFNLPAAGEHMALNALAAVALGRHFSLTDDQIAAGLAGMANEPMRLHRSRLGSGSAAIELINDAYNANPESTAAALAVLGEIEPSGTGRRVAILGDMRELGEHTAAAHRALAEPIAAAKVDLVILLGESVGETAAALIAAHPHISVAHWPDWNATSNESLAAEVATWIQPGDAVLLKASRSGRLERLVPALEARAAHGPATAGSASPTQRGKE